MMKAKTIHDKKQMQFGKSDFVVEHSKKEKVTDYYKIEESKVLGQGKLT